MHRPSLRALPIVALLPLAAAWCVDGGDPGPVVVAPMPIAAPAGAMRAVPEAAPADRRPVCAAVLVRTSAPDGPTGACVVPRRWGMAEGSMSTAVRTSAAAEVRFRRLLLTLAVGVALAAVAATGAAIRSRRSLEDRISDLGATAERLMPATDPAGPDPTAGDPIDGIRLALNAALTRIAGAGRETAAVLAHDLRTPITRLRLRLQAALAVPRPRRGDVRRALSECDDLAGLLTSLLRVASLERSEPPLDRIPVDLAELADLLHETFEPSARDGGRRLLLAACGPLVAEVDRPLVLQALSNLVDNALLHTPVGTTVTIRAERIGEVAVLSVADDGPGVPDEQRRRLGERFWRAGRTGDGTGHGLGLATASAIAAAHGGRILFEDAGPGLRASLTFPIAGTNG